MGLISGVLGDSSGQIITALFALGVVLVLIVLGVWLLKWVFAAAGKSGRAGRGPRLAVVETLQLDGRRQLLLIRRDNVEHLVLTGGAQDVLVEQAIRIEDVPAPTRRPVPMVAARRARPAAAAPVEPTHAHAATPAHSPPHPAPPVHPVAAPAPATAQASTPTAIERLRDFGRAAPQPKPVSLRHTGLLRPGSKAETETPHNPDNSTASPLDSAKQGAGPGSRESVESVGGTTKGDR